MASSSSNENDMLSLLKEYTQLKRMIDSCKRRNGRQPGIQPHFMASTRTNNRDTVTDARVRSRTANPYVLRTADRVPAASKSMYKMNFSGIASHQRPTAVPTVVTNVITKPLMAATATVSKYSWSSSGQASNMRTTSSNRKLLNPLLTSSPAYTSALNGVDIRQNTPKVIRKTSTKYKVINNAKPVINSGTGSSARSRPILRQVRKYSVKYVPDRSLLSKNSNLMIKSNNPAFVNGRYALRRRRSVSQAEQRLDGQTRNRRTNFIVIGKLLYKMSKTKLSRTGSAKTGNSTASSNSTRTTPKKSSVLRTTVTMKMARRGKEQIVSVRGIKFVMDPQRKTLRRVTQHPNLQQSNLRVGMSRVDIGSDTYVQSQPGVFVRSSGKQLRSLANRVINKSINRLTVKSQRSQQFCMFYNKFGKCSKRDKGDDCPYIHDSDKIAVCKRFLKGDCNVANCPFSHRLCRLKMPVCVFFLRGRCSSDTCRYRHVNVNRGAGVCVDFNRGYCPLGEKCKKWHVHSTSVWHRREREDKSKTDGGVGVTAVDATKERSIDGHDVLPAFISLSEFDAPSSSSEGIKEEIKTPVAEEEIRIKPKFVKKLIP